MRSETNDPTTISITSDFPGLLLRQSCKRRTSRHFIASGPAIEGALLRDQDCKFLLLIGTGTRNSRERCCIHARGATLYSKTAPLPFSYWITHKPEVMVAFNNRNCRR